MRSGARLPAHYAEAKKKRKHIQSSSSRAIPPKRPTAKGSVRQAVARRMALIPWQEHQEDVSAKPESCKKEPGSLARDTLQETQLKGWVSRVLQAALLDTTKLNALLTEAAQYKMSSILLRVTGAGPAVATAWIWSSLDPARQRKRAQLEQTWRQQLQDEVKEVKAKFSNVRIPPGTPKSLLLSSGWKVVVMDMRQWLSAVIATDPSSRLEEADDHHAARLAVRLVLSGFRNVDDLEGLPPSAIERLTNVPKEQAMLQQAVRVIEDLAFKIRSQKARRALGMTQLEGSGPRSARDVAAGLSPESLQDLEESNRRLEKEIGVQIGWEAHDESLLERPGPRATTVALAKARAAGKAAQVIRLLEQKEHELRLENQRKSLPQVASGLRCWHAFATALLDYDEKATLPPDNAKDICLWMTTFRCAATVANYLSHVRWACAEYRKDMSWSDPSIGSLLHEEDRPEDEAG